MGIFASWATWAKTSASGAFCTSTDSKPACRCTVPHALRRTSPAAPPTVLRSNNTTTTVCLWDFVGIAIRSPYRRAVCTTLNEHRHVEIGMSGDVPPHGEGFAAGQELGPKEKPELYREV